LESVYTRLLAPFSADVVDPVASTPSFNMFNQYASSDLVSFLSLSVVIDVICILFTSLLGNNMLVYLLLLMIYIQNVI
jgi:hypothetical protein